MSSIRILIGKDYWLRRRRRRRRLGFTKAMSPVSAEAENTPDSRPPTSQSTPGLGVAKGNDVSVEVVYPWLPSKCNVCLAWGHKGVECKSAKVTILNKNDDEKKSDEDSVGNSLVVASGEKEKNLNVVNELLKELEEFPIPLPQIGEGSEERVAEVRTMGLSLVEQTTNECGIEAFVFEGEQQGWSHVNGRPPIPRFKHGVGSETNDKEEGDAIIISPSRFNVLAITEEEGVGEENAEIEEGEVVSEDETTVAPLKGSPYRKSSISRKRGRSLGLVPGFLLTGTWSVPVSGTYSVPVSGTRGLGPALRLEEMIPGQDSASSSELDSSVLNFLETMRLGRVLVGENQSLLSWDPLNRKKAGACSSSGVLPWGSNGENRRVPFLDFVFLLFLSFREYCETPYFGSLRRVSTGWEEGAFYTPPPRLARASPPTARIRPDSVGTPTGGVPLMGIRQRLLAELFLLRNRVRDMAVLLDLLIRQVRASARWELMKEWLEGRTEHWDPEEEYRQHLLWSEGLGRRPGGFFPISLRSVRGVSSLRWSAFLNVLLLFVEPAFL
ncbi:hypothetical protein HID58_042800 [Brassica napus]|uniref:Uncharacterized protein n=1 Tax=Brassica napus TaxID=3708 RepID=A0ABQ8BEQ3_BRANA|nr:hypothetical protein HID58_042800 [Brassica napus]